RATVENPGFRPRFPITLSHLEDPRMRYHASNLIRGLRLLEQLQSVCSEITEALTWVVIEDIFSKHEKFLTSLRAKKRQRYPALFPRAQLFRRIRKFVPLTT